MTTKTIINIGDAVRDNATASIGTVEARTVYSAGAYLDLKGPDGYRWKALEANCDKVGPDLEIVNQGSVVGFVPLTDAAQAWLDEDVESEGWQYLGNTLYVDHRCADHLIFAAQEAGLEVT